MTDSRTQAILTELQSVFPTGWTLGIREISRMYNRYDRYPAFYLKINGKSKHDDDCEHIEHKIKICVTPILKTVYISDICGIYCEISYSNFDLAYFIMQITRLEQKTLGERSLETGVNIILY